jgi:Tol biopolymer transport system component
MDADGSRPRRLTRHDATDTMPAFSPQGGRIAFASDRDGNFEIYLIDLDGAGRPGRLQRLTQHPGLDTHPVFSPDGRWVAYTSERGGLDDETPLIPVFNAQPYGEIVATRIEDGLTVRLTHNKWEDGLPEWAAGSGGLDERHE